MRCSSGFFWLGKEAHNLLLGGQRHFGFRQRGVGRIALLAQILRRGASIPPSAPGLSARAFPARRLGAASPCAFARAFRLLRGQAVDLIDNGFNFCWSRREEFCKALNSPWRVAMATSRVRNSVWACCKPACNWVCSLSNAPLRRLISVTFSCKAAAAPCKSAIWFLRPRMEAAALPEPWPFK